MFARTDSVQVEEAHQFDSKPLEYFENLKLDWRQFLESNGYPFHHDHFDEDRGQKTWIFVTTKTDRLWPEVQAVTPEPNVLLKSTSEPFLQAIRTRQYEPLSVGAQDSVQRKKQKVDNPAAFFNGRPVSLTGPPLGLYHPIFSKFKRLATEMEAVGLTSNDLKFANELIHVSAQFYAHENDRRAALYPVLEKLLGVDYHADERIGVNQRTLKPDGACLDMTSLLDGLCLYWEAKREIGEGGCDPIDQVSEDYALTVADHKVHTRLLPSVCLD
ncbi:hypothetical protein BKA62DRAFT_827358 [Auriculariales sp. MPI-PUGE-AT-0066]|nr:hypothetical protein BKA62DRAFT_827358 [Auriculariales sp. MPI-PUGE-AT-0066]